MLNDTQLERYSRQLMLDEIGQDGQKKLLSSKVLVIGAGGLGSSVLFYLAAAGIGTIGIADFDTVSLSNLQRQILHTTKDLGRKKVDSAEEKLKNLNPDIIILKYDERINADNIKQIIQHYDVVIDAVDNHATRFIVNDCCCRLGKPLIEGAVLGFQGIILTIIPGKSPCYRCLYPSQPPVNVLNDIFKKAIIGMVAGTTGTLQALEAVKIILNAGRFLTGRMLFFDGLKMEFKEIELARNLHCPACTRDIPAE